MTSTLKIDTIEPEGGTTTLTVGESGQNTVIAGAGIKANVLKDAGGNAIFTSNGSGTISGLNSGFGSAQPLISSQAVTNQASISFTSGIDSTYKEYVFDYIDCNPVTDATDFSFQVSIDGGSNYNIAVTSTAFQAFNTEGGSKSLGYNAGEDQAQGTSFQILAGMVGNGTDECAAGSLHLFNPSSTTYVKNWFAETQFYRYVDRSNNSFFAGYFNTTTAINAVQFKFSSGNFDGTIKMYGIK